MSTKNPEILDGQTTIAIIGVGAKMPGALSAPAFWENIQNGVYAIQDVPADRWDASLYWDPDPNAADKTYSKIGGWVTGFEFDRKAFRMPPMVVDKTDPTQLLCLEAVREAMEDAGYLDRDFDRDRTAVILGNALGGDLRDQTNLRIHYAELDAAMRGALLEVSTGQLDDADIEKLLDTVEKRIKSNIEGINEDSMPGELANIIAGRVAQSFDLRGPNYVCDAACASTLAALESAVYGLRAGQFDMVVTGGADRSMGPPSYVKFSKIGALSPDGSRPFDADANGFVMGEGAGILILKRLADAIEDDDQIYGLVRGIGGSSDGRGKGITAPNPRGQQHAIRRAYHDAGVNPRSVSLIEAHGTSTPVGDPAEVESLRVVFDEDDAPIEPGAIGLGSVKSMIGHLKSAAAAASLVKMAYALRDRVLPPTINVETPNPRLELGGTPFRLQTERQPWEAPDRAPRRAGVSAFGFGGTNFHVVMEEYDPEGSTGRSKNWSGSEVTSSSWGTSTAKASGADEPLDSGVLAFAAPSVDALAEQFTRFAADYERDGLTATCEHQIPMDGSQTPNGAVRLALAYSDEEQLSDRVARAARALERRKGWRVLANQGVFFSEEPLDGEVAMLFPGQGTQYLGMLADLRERFPTIDETLREADRIMTPVLGEPLTSIIFPADDVDEADAFTRLSQTEITQPAVLTADIAILRTLRWLGIEPAMVAGHSLGEYGACVAAGVMTFEEALRTVARRGTEMAKATPMNGDPGLMAGVSMSAEQVQEVLDTIDGYVVCANKNCSKQTIIAGLTEPVEEAIAKFEADDHSVVVLPVSHAFHSKVVAAASDPLRRHLDTVEIQSPHTPILTNVTGDFYPRGEDVEDDIRELLSKQVAAPVEFISLVEKMYDTGARVFVEVGPKRAQTSFVNDILEGRPHAALYTNHPKKGDIGSLFEALAQLWSVGAWHGEETVAVIDAEANVAAHDKKTDAGEPPALHTPAKTADQHNDGPPVAGRHQEALGLMIDILCEKTGYDPDEIEPDFELEADLGIDTVKQAEIMATVREHYGFGKDDDFRLAEYPTLERLADYIVEQLGDAGEPPALRTPAKTADQHNDRPPVAGRHQEALGLMIDILCEKTGYDPDEIEPDFELEADLGIDTVKQAEIMATVREHYGFGKDDDFRLAEYPTLERLADYIVEQLGDAGEPPTLRTPAKTADQHNDRPPAAGRHQARTEKPVAARHDGPRNWEHPHNVPADVVISGASLGLPGTDEFFAEDAVDTLLSGRNMIGDIPDGDRDAMATKRITRLIKREDGTGEMVDVDDPADVLKLAGRMGAFDLEEFDIPDRLVKALDKTSQLAIAAGLLALRDAGLPLVPKYRTTTTGKKLTVGWTLPEKVGDETGVILASAFAGQDALVDELTRSLTDDDYQFDHRFLLQILGIANSRFAELVGARGPNTKINNACASTTTAVALAQDWIRAGRCKRVVILGADNASGDELMEWIGSGFLATGAATTEGDVTRAALPFDRRRNGIIIGMGAVGLVVEQAGLPESRGFEPLADVLATRIANSALHPTRLDVDHIADEVGQLIDEAEGRYDIDRHDFAKRTVFVSHETYSPARGGSAQTEIESLRRTFGDDANDVVIANTKGFTGHAMGAGIEDVLAIKAMQHEKLPHIANFEEPDPELGDLRLSEGGDYELDYALRLAAGFGSQLALALLRFRSRDDNRTAAPERYEAWLRDVSGFEHPDLQVEHRTLRLREGDPKQTQPSDEPETQPLRETGPMASAPTESVRRTPVRGTTVVADPSDGTFERLGVVVEAHAAAGYDLTTLRGELSDRRVAVVAGPMLVTELVVRALERCGASVLVVEDRDLRNPLEGDVAVCDLTDEAAIAREFESFGPIDGIVNLLGFGAERFGSNDVYRAARHSFHVARAWRFAQDSAPSSDQFFVTITGMGGRLGFDRATGPLPVCGAVAGFTKALAREWEDATIRVVDVARTGFDPNLGLQVLHEALRGSGVEIGLIGGVRYIPSTVRAEEITPETLPSMAPDADDVLIVTGGAKGITAEVAFDLATRYGCSLALVGRTALTHDDPLAVDIDAEKERIRAELGATGERVTPIMVRDALAGLRSQRTIAENMQRMRSAGSEVEYFSCDVSDEASVAEMIDAVHARFGRIDGVIHGAGVEESRLIEDKDVAGFDRVFRGKALGALHLWSAAEQYAPSFYVAFSSVAGRFGNPGQVDYSAANEVLNKLVALLNATGKVRATSIDWTAWDEVGMAADGGMRTLLEARGVELLPPSIGAPMVGDFLEAGMAGEFVVAGALGDFARDEEPEARSTTPRSPLVSDVTERDEERVVVTRTIDLDQDRFARDHVYEGTPIVPGVMGFEMMVEAASLLADESAAVVRNVQFEKAIKLHHDEPIQLEATAERNGRTVEVVVRTHRTARTGRKLVSEHYRATVGFGETTTSDSFTLSPRDLVEGPDAPTIYERYFHEGTFQVLDEVPWLGENFAIGIGRLPNAELTAGFDNAAFITDPMVREMAFQTAGLWGMANHGMSYLPWSIDRAEQFGSAVAGAPVCIRCLRRDDADEHMIAFDVEVLAGDGKLLQRMERVQLVGHRKLTDEERFDAFPPHRVRTRRLDAATAERVLDRIGVAFDDLVDDEERKAYDRLISERRKGEWLAARVAMKTLAAEYVRDFQGIAVSPVEIRIRKDDHKAPYLVVDGRDDIHLPAISISHSGGVSVAGITAGDEHAVGIDLEAIEERDEAFARNYFSDAELALDCPGDRATLLAVLWATKESVSKALGIGLHARLEEMEIRDLRSENGELIADVALSGMADDAWNEHQGRNLDVRVAIEQERVFATAVMHVETNTAQRATLEMDSVARPADREQVELAAIAALLKHRGLIGTNEQAGETTRTSVPSWKAEH